MYDVLRNPEVFSSTAVSIAPFPGKVVPEQLDPPEHTAFRQALGPLLSPHRLAPLEPETFRIAGELIDGFAGRGSCECWPSSPTRCRPGCSWPGWAGRRTTPRSSPSSRQILVLTIAADDEVKIAAGLRAAAEVMEYFGRVVAQVPANPGDDFTSHLATIRLHSSEPIGDDDLLDPLFESMLACTRCARRWASRWSNSCATPTSGSAWSTMLRRPASSAWAASETSNREACRLVAVR
jgi:cytochrome P450